MNFPLFFEAGRYTGRLWSRWPHELVLLERKYCCLGGNAFSIVSEEQQQHFYLNQNTEFPTVKESLVQGEICPHGNTCRLIFKIVFGHLLQLTQGAVEVHAVINTELVLNCGIL